MFHSDTFKNKIALVTGGRSGIGFQIAKDLLHLGAKVIICSRKEDALKKACDSLSEHGEVSYQKCDIRIEDERINNNLNGTFYMTRDMASAFFIPQRAGVIVNIIVGMLRGFPGMIHTGAARAGVENMSKTLAQEWSAFNIRINCVAPGIIESSGLDQYPQPIQDLFDAAKKDIPMGRFGTVEEVSNAVCFLASPLSSYINGISLYVDGSQHLNYNKMGLANVLKSYV